MPAYIFTCGVSNAGIGADNFCFIFSRIPKSGQSKAKTGKTSMVYRVTLVVEYLGLLT